jgi:hypothetical protein
MVVSETGFEVSLSAQASLNDLIAGDYVELFVTQSDVAVEAVTVGATRTWLAVKAA